jgi:long-chain acyl-CoA synthetase
MPDLDVVNAIALGRCGDTRHRIHFRDASGRWSLTLAELDAQAVAVARHLQRLGVGAGDRVGIMAPNRIEWVLLDLAVMKLGAVTAGFEHGRFDAARLISEYGLKLLFTTPGDGARVVDINVVATWSADDTTREGPPLHSGFDRADIVAIKFTSGSTGLPKGLEATVASVNASLAAVQQMFGHGDGDNLLVFLRLALLQQRYWIYSALVNGHDVTLADTEVDQALAMAVSTAPTVVMGVPGFYEELKSRLEAAGPLPHPAARKDAIQAALGGRIRYLWTGSAPASRAVLHFFNDAAVPLYEGYGLNETCIVAKNHPGAFRLGSVGKVVPGKSIRFDRDGVLIVGARAPVNCRYTWCGPGDERTFLPTGEVRTHDLGYLDEDGFLYIQGRADDVLTLGSGRNVLVRPTEEKLRQHPAVHECVLYGHGRAFLSAIISPGEPGALPDLPGYVDELNRGALAEQRVHALVLAGERFSVENGLLTSQFKPRRAEILRRYASDLDAIYARFATPPAPVPLIAHRSPALTAEENAK